MNTDERPVVAARQAIEANMGHTDDPKLLLIAAKCRALISGYHIRWRSAGYKSLAIERFVEASLTNPETNRISRTFGIAGVEDVIVEYNAKRILFDHKTTSQDISDPDAPYWRQLVVESQPSHYMLLEWLNGQKCDGAVWDVMRKPMISPKKLTKAELTQVAATGCYFDCRLSEGNIRALPAIDRESYEMYEARLAHDCIKERPEWYFQRRSIPRLDCEILEYGKELWEHGQEILHARNTHRHARNSGACMLYGSPCKFLGVCSGHDTPDSDRWTKKTNVHNELPQLAGDGRNVITNSRVRCFQTCRRKHYYEYELGIERQDEEEKESLIFGTLWHFALASWWSCFTEESNNVNSNTDSPGSELGQSSVDTNEASVAF